MLYARVYVDFYTSVENTPWWVWNHLLHILSSVKITPIVWCEYTL